MRLNGERGLGIIDTLIVLVLISVFIGVLIPKYERTAREAQEVALRMSLSNIRMAIQVYVLTQRRIPSDLQELLKERYVLPTKEGTIFTDQYLKTSAVDESGRPIDPFGKPFGYEPASGRVYSTTRGYETW